MKKLFGLLIVLGAVGISVYFFYLKKMPHYTFTKEVAPIIYKKCASCHRSGQSGLFPLITYNDITRRLKTIEYVVEKKIMPPWPAD